MKGKVMSIIPIFIPHAGCPHQCVFATRRKSAGKTASAEAVRQQIEKYLQWIKPGKENEAAFYGGSFTGLDIALQKNFSSRLINFCRKESLAACAYRRGRII